MLNVAKFVGCVVIAGCAIIEVNDTADSAKNLKVLFVFIRFGQVRVISTYSGAVGDQIGSYPWKFSSVRLTPSNGWPANCAKSFVPGAAGKRRQKWSSRQKSLLPCGSMEGHVGSPGGAESL
jgi:hypothetical protein